MEKVSTEEQFTAFRALAAKPGAVAKKADVSKLATAPKKISAVYEFPYLAHAPMEPLNCVVDLKRDGCTIWAGSQFQTMDQAAAARTAGLKPEQVTLHTMMAGGGFGRRAVPSSDYIVEAVNVAKAYAKAGKAGPVKVIWSREDDIKGGYYRPAHVHRAALGLDAADAMWTVWQSRVHESFVDWTDAQRAAPALRPPPGSAAAPRPRTAPDRAAVLRTRTSECARAPRTSRCPRPGPASKRARP